MITTKHLNQMRHAVGFYSDNPGYRNNFHTSPEDYIWIDLKEWGFAEGGIERLGSFYYWVSELGKELIGLEDQIRFTKGLQEKHSEEISYIEETYEIDLDY